MKSNEERNKPNSRERSSSPSDVPDNAKLLKNMFDIYLESNPVYRSDRKINEIEVRFGTNPNRNRNIQKVGKFFLLIPRSDVQLLSFGKSIFLIIFQ